MLVDTLTVATGVVLSIAPGVTVKASSFGDQTPFGNVALIVDGVLQVEGTHPSPVTFTATDPQLGWRGIVLRGDGSVLGHARISYAYQAILVRGRSHKLFSLRISESQFGVDMWDNAYAAISDLLILGGGRPVELRVGIRLNDTASATIHDSVIAGVDIGISARSELLLENSALINNRVGLQTVTSGTEHNGVTALACPGRPSSTTFSEREPSTLPRVTLRRVDVVGNYETGIHVLGALRLSVEESEIRDNGLGVRIETNQLHPDSTISQSNMLRNRGLGQSYQIWASHRSGTLKLLGDHWGTSSNDELATNWRAVTLGDEICASFALGAKENGGPCSPKLDADPALFSCPSADGALACRATADKLECFSYWTSVIVADGFPGAALTAGMQLELMDAGIVEEYLSQLSRVLAH